MDNDTSDSSKINALGTIIETENNGWLALAYNSRCDSLFLDEIDHLLHSCHILSILFPNGHTEFLLQCHDYLHLEEANQIEYSFTRCKLSKGTRLDAFT